LLSAVSRRATIRAVKRSGNSEPPFTLWDRDFPGTRSGSLVGDNAAVLIRLRTVGVFGNPTSRLYIGGPSQNDQFGGQWLQSFAENQIQHFCDDISSPVLEDGGGSGMWQPVVISQKVLRSGNYSDAAWSAASHPVWLADYSGRIASLRKRMTRVRRHGLNDTQPNVVT